MENGKVNAAKAAIELVEDGMRLGLGTGSTAAKFIDLLGEKVSDGLQVLCVPTSEATRAQAEKLGIPLTTLDETPILDLTVDGADEIAEDLTLVKGGGGALLREKVVAFASNRMVVIADESKLVEELGAFPLPIEVLPFGYKSTQEALEEIATECQCTGTINLRTKDDGSPFITDNGNYILDYKFENLSDPFLIEEMFKIIPGVITTGFFIGMAHFAIIGNETGVEVIEWTQEDYPEEAMQ